VKGGVQMKSVCIVIVTWNRLEMLKACVAAAKKNAAVADILVVDNASTDGTHEWLGSQDGISVLSLPENTGGAGGFAAGMKWAYDRGYGWMWIMDDDVVPLEGALDVLAANKCRADVIQGAKYEADGSECVFEGLVNPRTMRRRKIRVADVPKCGYVSCNVATFEGLFVSRRVVEVIGVPDASFFYGLDDLLYGYQASEKSRFIFVPRFVLKKQIDKSRANIAGRRFYSSTPQSRYYHVRNYWKVMRYLRDTGVGSWRIYTTYFYEAAKAFIITMLMEWNFKGAFLVLRGIADGIRGRGGKS
jgi:GT2 family glycosyltransferase